MRRFVGRTHPTLHGVTSAYAVALSLLILYGGIGHTIAVAAVHIRGGRVYDYRFATLLGIGGVLIFGAMTNLILAWWIAHKRRWALAWSLSVTIAITSYAALLLPLPAARDAAGPAVVLNASYAAVLTIALIVGRRQRISRSTI